MKQLLLLVLSAGTLTGQAQVGTWRHVAIADSVTADFPAEPQKHVQNGATAYGIYLDSALYSIAILHNEQSENIADEDKQEFYDGIIKGAAERAHATGTSAKKIFRINGFEGVETTFQPQLAKLSAPTTMRVALINGTVYNQFFSANPSPTHVAARQRFFASFTPHQRPGPPVKTRAYRIGELTGRLAFYGLLLAGVLYLVRRPGKKNRSNPTA